MNKLSNTTRILFTLLALLVVLINFSEQSINLPGGKTPESDKNKIKELLEFMTVKLMETPYQSKIHEIVKVERQVVNGFNYYITMYVISNDKIRQLVEAKIFESLRHAHDFELISVEKKDSTQPTDLDTATIPGGRNKLTDYLKITELINFLQQKLLETENQSVIRKVLNIEKQVVNGTNYFIVVHLEFASNGLVKVMKATIHEPPIFAGSSNLQLQSLLEINNN